MDKKTTYEEFQQTVNKLEREARRGTNTQEALEESVQRLKVAYDQSTIYEKALREEIEERQRAEKALKEAHEDLEARVEQRTGELVKANAILSEEIERRKKAEKALKKAHNELERRVEERTVELEAVNAQLMREIQERQRAEEASRASEANYRAIFNAINDAILVHDVETGDIVDVNWRMFEMYGVSPTEVRQLTHDNVEQSLGGPPYTAESASEWFKKAAKGEAQLFEWRAKDSSGREFWVEVNLKRALISGQHRLLAVVRDITERKLAQEKLITYHDKLRAMASRLSLAEEKERRRIATEVHDHIGQNLAFAKIKLGTLLRSTNSESLRKAVDQVVRMVDEAIRDTRALISELGSPILYELGFSPAVDWLTQHQATE
jgi:PAS domain S-box-containing protein